MLVRAPWKIGTYKSTALAHVQTANGEELNSQSIVGTLRVKRSVHAIVVHVRGLSSNGFTLRGKVSARFAKGVRHVPGLGAARGSFVLRRAGSALVLTATNLRLERFGAVTRVRVTVRLLAPRRAACGKAAQGTLLVVGSPSLRQDGSTHDFLQLKLPLHCGARAIRFNNDAPLSGTASVSVSAS